MSTRKSMTFPVVITFIIILIIVYLFTTIKQTEIICNRVRSFDKDVKVTEDINTIIDGKKITGITVVKTIVLPSSYADETHLNSIKYSLQKTLEYLGDKVKYSINDNIIKVTINVHKNEIVLLNNISFVVNDDLEIIINSNTKSSEVIPITVGDNYTDGEFMMHMKNYVYSKKKKKRNMI